MKRPEPYWQAEYRNDRRKHRHRCRLCNRIIGDGETVFMCRTGSATVAVHAGHEADTPDLRQRMTAWGLAGLKRLGWRVPELDTHFEI